MANGFSKSFTEAFAPALVQSQRGAQASQLQSQKTEKEQERIKGDLERLQKIKEASQSDKIVGTSSGQQPVGQLVMEAIEQEISGGADFGQAVRTGSALSDLLTKETPQQKRLNDLKSSLLKEGIDINAGQSFEPTGENVSQRVNPQSSIAQAVSQKREELEESKARRQVKTQVQKDALTRIEKLQGLIPVLDQFDNLLSSVPTGTGFKGRTQGAAESLQGTFQTDPFSATIKAQAEALRPQIARGFGDVGNLSVVEQKTAGKFVPRLQDSEDTRVLKNIGGLTFIKRKVEDAVGRAELSDDPIFQATMEELDSRIQKAVVKAKELGVDRDRLKKFIGEQGLSDKEFPSELLNEKNDLKRLGLDPEKFEIIGVE